MPKKHKKDSPSQGKSSLHDVWPDHLCPSPPSLRFALVERSSVKDLRGFWGWFCSSQALQSAQSCQGRALLAVTDGHSLAQGDARIGSRVPALSHSLITACPVQGKTSEPGSVLVPGMGRAGAGGAELSFKAFSTSCRERAPGWRGKCGEQE